MATSWYSYFDGSDFYSRRSKYRTQLLESAKSVIKNYELETYIYDTSGTYTLTDEEYTYLQNNYDSYYAELKAKYLPTTGTFSISGRIISYTRYGVKRYTDIRGEQKARLETQYIMDMISAAQVATWLATLAVGIATSWLFGAGTALIVGVVTTIVTTISLIVFDIIALVQKAKSIGLTAAILSETLKGNYLSSANSYMASKNLDAGDTLIWKGKEAFAAGSIYMSGCAGSNNSYTPSLAYNPSSKFTGLANKDNYSLAGDYTQGRNQYKMAGNEGYFSQIAPKLELATISDLNPDAEYKLNTYKNKNEKILRGYSELAEFIGTDDDNDCSTWIQSWYDYENDNYKNNYYTYAQSTDTIERLRYYPKALRADLDFYSQWQEERDNARESTSTITQSDITSDVKVVTEDDLSDIYDGMDYSETFNLWLQSQMIAEEEGEYQYYDTESKEFLEYKLAFFEALDINYLINAGVLDGIISGYLTTGASDEEYLNFYTEDYITDAYKAYILAKYSGLSISFDASVCKDALGYYFGLFSSSYNSSLVIGMDIDTFLSEDYANHSKITFSDDKGKTFTVSLVIYTKGYTTDSYGCKFNIVSSSTSGTWQQTIINYYYSTNGDTSPYAWLVADPSGYTKATNLNWTRASTWDSEIASFCAAVRNGKTSYETTLGRLYSDLGELQYLRINAGALSDYLDYAVLTSDTPITLSVKNLTSSDEANSIPSTQTLARVGEGYLGIFAYGFTFSPEQWILAASFTINDYYDSDEVYNAALEWLESEKASLKEQIESAKTQAEIEAEIAASLE